VGRRHRRMNAAKGGISRYLIPIFLEEVQTRGSPLNTSTINENVYIATHYVESFLKEAFDGFKIIEVTKHNLRPCTDSTDGIECIKVGVSTWGRGSIDKAEGRASLSESQSASSADT
jgi:hypothetical protein